MIEIILSNLLAWVREIKSKGRGRPQAIDAVSLLPEITFNAEFRVVNLWKVRTRLWVAKWLIMAGAWVAGAGLEVNQRVGVVYSEEESHYETN